MFVILSGHFWINLDLVIGSLMLGAPVRALFIRNLFLSKGAMSAVVWL